MSREINEKFYGGGVLYYGYERRTVVAKAELFQKEIPKSERVFYYESDEDDPIKTTEQEKKVKVELPDDYVYIHKNPFYKLYSGALFRSFWGFAQWYEKVYLEGEFIGREKLKAAKKTGYVLYANHTNPFHDVFGPAVVAGRRIRTVISPVNLKVPGIGKLLPALGGAPLGSTPKKKAEFNEAIDEWLRKKNAIVIYPEAHVWPYYTGIHKFPAGDKSFKYPVRNKVPVYTMTTTYQKSRKKKRGELPRMTIYVDGPFYSDPKLSDEENRAMLAKKVYESMVKWSKKSSYEYFEYRKKDGGGGKAVKDDGSRDKELGK